MCIYRGSSAAPNVNLCTQECSAHKCRCIYTHTHTCIYEIFSILNLDPKLNLDDVLMAGSLACVTTSTKAALAMGLFREKFLILCSRLCRLGYLPCWVSLQALASLNLAIDSL